MNTINGNPMIMADGHAHRQTFQTIRIKPVWVARLGSASINQYLEELESQIREEHVCPLPARVAQDT